jgi:1-acyl-sn-glycerol-3-phosphate acyltransferase
MQNVTAAIRMLGFVIGSCIFVPWAWVMREARGGGNVDSAKLFHKMACFVFSIKLRIIGTPREHGETPTVFVSNHVSHLDIPVLGSHLNARFVAKADVADWPVMGTFAKTQRTIFIERTKSALEGAKDMIGDAIRDGFNIILFAEGTSTDGREVKPFKASLFQMFYENPVNALVQPVAIVIERAGGKKPDDQETRDIYAWWRPEEDFASHLWKFAKAGGATISVHYLPVLDPKNFPDRKALAAAATKATSSAVAA